MVEVQKSEKLPANLKLTLSLQDRLSCTRSISLAFALRQSHVPAVVIQLPFFTLLCSPCALPAPRVASPPFSPRATPLCCLSAVKLLMRALKPTIPESMWVDAKCGFPCLCQMRSVCPASIIKSRCSVYLSLLLPLWLLLPLCQQIIKPPGCLSVYVAIGSCCYPKLAIFAAVDTSARWMKAGSDLSPHATSSLPLWRNYRFSLSVTGNSCCQGPCYVVLANLPSLSCKHYLVIRGWLEVIPVVTLAN